VEGDQSARLLRNYFNSEGSWRLAGGVSEAISADLAPGPGYMKSRKFLSPPPSLRGRRDNTIDVAWRVAGPR